MNTDTSWTLILRAGAGDAMAREAFARRYVAAVRACLMARWSGTPWTLHVDDAIQEVFVECFKHDGVLGRAARGRGSGFRAFLFAVTRNVGRRFERDLHARRHSERQDSTAIRMLAVDERDALVAFDAAFAQSIVDGAAKLHAERAAEGDAGYRRRFDILQEHLAGESLKKIAERHGEDPQRVYRANARARREYRECLLEIAGLQTGLAGERLEEECRRLIALL